MAGILAIFCLASANDHGEVCLDLTEKVFLCHLGFESGSRSQTDLGTIFGTTHSDTMSTLRFARNTDGKVHNLA